MSDRPRQPGDKQSAAASPPKPSQLTATTDRANTGESIRPDGLVDSSESPASDFGSLSDFRTPYLTCSRCNSVVFINVLLVRPKDAAAAAKKPVTEYEQVPACPGCGSTRYLRAGVVSFQEQIEEKKRAIREFERRRVPATALIQRIARGFLGRLAFRRRLVERERHLRKINRAATRIQSRVRGMQARRRSLIERCLVIIKRLAPSILAHAISSTAHPDRPPVFWYANPAELNIFYWNYREFVRRAGGKPSLIQVEKNVMEITRRMLMREYELVSRIQARWRGVTSRLVFREFKRQKGWWNSIRQSPAIKIQRLFRAHTDRKRCRALRVKNKYPQQRQAYREEMATKQDKQRAQAFRDKLMNKYRAQVKADSSERMLARHRGARHGVGNQAVDISLRHGDSLDASALSPETFVNLQFSLGRGGDTGTNCRSTTQDQENGTRRTASTHPNAQRFARLKHQLEAKHLRVRGPRLHILKAQQYAPGSTELLSSDSERD